MGNWQPAAGEEHRRPAGAEQPPLDLGHLQVRIDRLVHAEELLGTFQIFDAVLQVSITHEAFQPRRWRGRLPKVLVRRPYFTWDFAVVASGWWRVASMALPRLTWDASTPPSLDMGGGGGWGGGEWNEPHQDFRRNWWGSLPLDPPYGSSPRRKIRKL